MAAGMRISGVITKMNEWSKKYNIGYSYKRICTHNLEVYLEDSERYDFFCLTWNDFPYYVVTESTDRIRNPEPINYLKT